MPCLKFDTLKVFGPSFFIQRHGMRSAGSRKRCGDSLGPGTLPDAVVFYYTASPRGVLVFHAFVKKTQRTPPLEIELARKRLQELLNA